MKQELISYWCTNCKKVHKNNKTINQDICPICNMDNSKFIKKTFYYDDSNTGELLSPNSEGWFISFITESTDRGALKVDREPLDYDDALVLLKENMDWEWENGKFYARVSDYGFHGIVEKIK